MEANVPHEAQPRQGLGVDHESLQQPQMNKGGWITFPFLGAAMMGLGLATSGALSNLVVYLIKEYNVPSVDASQIANIINGCINLAPVAGAVVADAFFGCYPVVAISMAFAVLSTVVFTLTASLRGLRPAPCHLGAGACEPASAGQMSALYAGVFLLCVSAAGSRFKQATMGADQFDSAADRDVLFNWFFVFLYASTVLGSTVIVYVQDTVSWTLGFAISAAASVVGFVAVLLGARYYRRSPVRGSPFTELARVAVAAARKWKVNVPTAGELKFYHGRRWRGDIDDDKAGNGDTDLAPTPTDSFSSLLAVWYGRYSLVQSCLLTGRHRTMRRTRISCDQPLPPSPKPKWISASGQPASRPPPVLGSSGLHCRWRRPIWRQRRPVAAHGGRSSRLVSD